MLTPESYWLGLACYGVSAIMGIVLIHRYWLARFGSPWRGLVTAWLAALLLTPAYPSADASTLAPALVSFLFNMAFAGGWPAAKGPAIALTAALVVAPLLAFFAPRRRARRAVTGALDNSQ